MAKKRKKKENTIRVSKGLHDPNRYFRKSGLRCVNLKVNFTIDKDYIIYAIHELLNYDCTEDPKNKINRKNVKIKINRELYYSGAGWIEESEYDSTRESERWSIAEELAKKLYPAYFEHVTPNSVRLILED